MWRKAKKYISRPGRMSSDRSGLKKKMRGQYQIRSVKENAQVFASCKHLKEIFAEVANDECRQIFT